MSTSNPFPLNISTKEDSWEKLQILEHVDPSVKYTAAEWNLILQALNYLYENTSIVPGQDNPNIENSYATLDEMLADQENQTQGAFQFVENASAHSEIESGYAYFEKLATSDEDEDDYRILSAQEVQQIEGSSLQKVGDQLGNEFQTALKVIYGIGFKVKPIAGGGYQLDLNREITDDTGALVQLKPFGNRCNSGDPNDNSTIGVVGGSSHGDFARITITTNGKTEFPTVSGGNLKSGLDFEADTTFDLWIENDNGTINYWFLD